ncbi:hypothetical protein GCM10022224_101250 [Nonomuraea antimicrobica]|uniref:Excreted virulence factor EspC, type VII ESX diderm n=1 Tax=Nonomuraea antimicrobica TaxID=561173 RepID=A0ABP7EMP3_9ACTN
MAGFDIHFDALDDCRTSTKTLVGKFGDLAESYPAQRPDSTIFGRLEGSSGLADAVLDVETTCDSEFGKAKSLLDSVERALSLVEETVRRANDPR